MAHLNDKEKLLNRVRRIRGQVDAIERTIQEDADCPAILHLIVGVRGSLNSLMAEIFEDHITEHMLRTPRKSRSEQVEAARDMVDVVNAYLK
jgi:DNA-binding FrmR family transcriptional regulator